MTGGGMEGVILARLLVSQGRGREAVAMLQELRGGSPPPAVALACVGELVGILAQSNALEADGEGLKLTQQLRELDPWWADMESLWMFYGRAARREGLDAAAAITRGAAERSPRLRARMALVITKLNSDEGHLLAARRWGLAAMVAAREAASVDLLAAAAGAMGEILVLGGAPMAALDLFRLDTGLLPLGAAEVGRLRTYRAHCLRQVGSHEAARSLAEEALQSSLRDADGGAPYARRALCWCEALELATGSDQGGVLSRLRGHLAALEEDHPEPYSLGLTTLAMGWAQVVMGDRGEAARLVAVATERFGGPPYDPEREWCQSLLAGATPTRLPASQEWPEPDGAASACDRWIEEVAISDLHERRLATLGRFWGRTRDDGLAWMGLFF